MTDPNVIEALDSLTRMARYLVAGLPLKVDADRARAAVDALLAAAEKPAAQADEPIGIGANGAPLFPAGRAEKPPAPVVPPAPASALPWVVRRKENGRAVAAFFDAGLSDDFMRDMRPLSDAWEVAPAAPAPAIVPVAFDAHSEAHGDGWEATRSSTGDNVFVTIDLRPGEDAGELVATLLAAGGRAA